MSLFIYKDKKFTHLSHENITPKGEIINPIDLGISTQKRYFFHADFKKKFIVDYSIGGIFERDFSDKSTPPYSMLITGTFTKVKDGSIIYKGGFSIS